MKHLVCLLLLASMSRVAHAGMEITEWMYSGSDGEFIEFTNTGSSPVDMTGWSFDDDSQVAGTLDLSGFGVVAAGQSVILTEAVAEDFATAWGLSDVVIIGGNTVNLGRADQINLYDSTGTLVDQLVYGDQTYTGTVRTQNASCNIPLDDDGFTVVQASWSLATVGDTYGSWASAKGDIGSPGTAPVPETEETSLVSQLCGSGFSLASLGIMLGFVPMRLRARHRN